MRRLLAPAFVAVFVLAACGGGGGGTKEEGAPVGGATMVPADAKAFLRITTDLDSTQAKQADALLKKFPGRQKLLTQIRGELADENLDWETDIKPALGSEIDIAVLDYHEDHLVGLAQAKNPDKFASLVKTGNDPPKIVEKRAAGWVVFGDTKADVDRIGAAGPKLADRDEFKDANGKLPAETLATAWVDGKAALQAIAREASGQFDASKVRIDWLAAALEAREEGAALRLVAKGKDAQVGESYHSDLIDKVPSGTLVFATFKVAQDTLDNALKQAGPSVQLLEGFIGVRLSDVFQLFSGETALFARAGNPIPEATLVLDDVDASRKLATLRTLAQKLVGLAGGAAETRQTTIDGSSMTEISFSGVSVFFGESDGRILITDTRNAIRDLRGSGDSLADDPAFSKAQDAAGMPDDTGGFLYVNLKDSIPEILRLAAAGDESVTPEVQANLRPLRSLLAWATPQDDVTSFDVFLEVG